MLWDRLFNVFSVEVSKFMQYVFLKGSMDVEIT